MTENERELLHNHNKGGFIFVIVIIVLLLIITQDVVMLFLGVIPLANFCDWYLRINKIFETGE